MNETGSDETTPEQLLQILDAQLAARRSQSAASHRNRAIFLVGGVIFILVAAAAALLVLGQMLEDFRQSGHPSQAETVKAPGNF